MGIEQPVDQMQIARPATARTDRQPFGGMGLTSGKAAVSSWRTCIQSIPALAAQRFGEAIQAVAHDAIDPAHAGQQGFTTI
jgi:hypothetical protein